MSKDDITLRDVLDAVVKGFTAIEKKMATKDELAALRTDMNDGFNEVNRHIEKAVEPRLDDHAHRIKKLEEEVFPR
jgi:hypothetical protein